MNEIEIIKQYRKKHHITQRDLSIKLNQDINYWQRVESNKQELKYSDFVKIIKILRIPVEYFFKIDGTLISTEDKEELISIKEKIENLTKKF